MELSPVIIATLFSQKQNLKVKEGSFATDLSRSKKCIEIEKMDISGKWARSYFERLKFIVITLTIESIFTHNHIAFVMNHDEFDCRRVSRF